MAEVDTRVEDHWKYSGEILEICLPDLVPKETVIKLSHYFYTKVWAHAVRHEKEDASSSEQ